MTRIAIVVYWCLASTSFDGFDPHRLNAAQSFVAANPESCRADPPLELDPAFGPVLAEQCRRDAMLRYMPGWLQKNEGKVWLYAECVERGREPLDLEALKGRVEH